MTLLSIRVDRYKYLRRPLRMGSLGLWDVKIQLENL